MPGNISQSYDIMHVVIEIHTGKFNSAAARLYNVDNVNTMILRVTTLTKTSWKKELIFGIEKEQQKENA